MSLSKIQQRASIAIAAAVISCIPASSQLVAASPATTSPTVTYTASGTFAATPVSGTDLYKLAGQPFTISVVASESLQPAKSGPTWAQYKKLKMTATVQSGLLPTPFPISSSTTSIELAYGNKSYDVFALFAPIKVLGAQINITAMITMPKGTLTNAMIAPFKGPVTMTPSSAAVSYADGTNGTTKLGLSGSLTATAK